MKTRNTIEANSRMPNAGAISRSPGITPTRTAIIRLAASRYRVEAR